MSLAFHTSPKTQKSLRERMARACARASFLNTRLLPIIWKHETVAWCGWSMRDSCAHVFHHFAWMDRYVDKDGLLFGYTNVDNLLANISAGQLRQIHWFKQNSGATKTSKNWSHMYGVGGWPNPGVWNGTAFTARQHTDQESGVMMHGGNVSPATKVLLSSHVRTMDISAASEFNVACLYDMVLTYDQCTLAITSTNFTNVLTAQRYIGGSDPGLSIMGCGNTTQTSNAVYDAFTYTSIGGVSQSIPSITSFGACADTATPGPTVPPSSCFESGSTGQGILSLPLVTGDSGAKQLNAVTMSAVGTPDQNNYILGFQLAWLPWQGTDNTHAYDYVKQAPSLPIIRDGAALTIAMLFVGATSIFWQAGFNVGWA